MSDHPHGVRRMLLPRSASTAVVPPMGPAGSEQQFQPSDPGLVVRHARVRGIAVTSFLRRHRRWVVPGLVAALLGQMAVALLTAASQQSPTVDEPVYVGAAVVYLTRHSLQVNPEHPPLAKLVAATGLVFAHVHLSHTYRGTEWQIGDRVLYGPGNNANHVLWLARLPMILLTLLFGLVVFAFGHDVFGARGGLTALGLYAFSPDVIAHGSLVTLDVPMAGFLLTTVWLLWRGRRRPWPYLGLAGLAYGCALATKMPALFVLPVVFVLAGLSVWSAQRPASSGQRPTGGNRPYSVRRRVVLSLGAAAGVVLVAVAVVWASYLIIDPHLRFSRTSDMSGASGLGRALAELLPFPDAYRGGMLVQLGFEQQVFDAYLFGHHYPSSVWYYLPAALLVKTPLGMVVLWLGAVGVLATVRRMRPLALYLLLPLAVLMPATMAGSRNLGVRYVIWLPMFLAVASAAVFAYRRRWVVPVALALLTFVAVSSLRTFPYYLPYSNEAFGGPSNTYLYLNDSNVDWGQDLRRLGEYLAANPTNEQIWLIYKGRGRPAFYGIRAADPTAVSPDQVHGLLAVSVMRLTGSSDGYAAFIGGRAPVTTIGHTIRIYRIP